MPDLKKVEQWASIFEYPEHLGEALTYNWMMNKDTVKMDV